MISYKKFKLGDRVRDKITGYEGVVTSITFWLNGCVRLAVQATVLKDGKPVEAEWIDDQQVELAQEGKGEKKKPRGGPMPNPKRSRDPRP